MELSLLVLAKLVANELPLSLERLELRKGPYPVELGQIRIEERRAIAAHLFDIEKRFTVQRRRPVLL